MMDKKHNLVKKKRRKKGDHWGVDKQTKHPWDIDIDTSDEPKVATSLPMVKPKDPYARETRKMRRES